METMTASDSEQHPLLFSIGLHLLPGILTGIVFFLIGPLVQRLKFPSFMALCIVDLIVLLPCIIGLLYYFGNQRNGSMSLVGIVLYRNKVDWRQYLLWVPIVFFASGLLVVLLHPVSNFLKGTLFSWWSDVYNLSPDLSPFPRSTLVFSYFVFFLMVVLAAPIAEEMYFRGFLLPRLSRLGLWALLPNSILFALFHVWSPWMAVARAVGLIPLIFVTQKKQNIYIGMLAHMLVNSIDLIAGIVFIIIHS